MRNIAIIIFVAGAGWAQTAPDPQTAPSNDAPPAAASGSASAVSQQASMAASKAAMAASVAKQRTSVLQQVTSITGKAAPEPGSFFTAPWIDSVSSLSPPACDPMPVEQLDKLIEDSSGEQGVKPDLVRAVINEESGGRPCAVSPKGAQGLMQLMPETAGLLGVRDAFDPRENVNAGTRLLKQLLTKYEGDVSRTLSAYNAGEARVDQDGGVPAIPETINYVKDILAKLAGQ